MFYDAARFFGLGFSPSIEGERETRGLSVSVLRGTSKSEKPRASYKGSSEFFINVYLFTQRQRRSSVITMIKLYLASGVAGVIGGVLLSLIDTEDRLFGTIMTAFLLFIPAGLVFQAFSNDLDKVHFRFFKIDEGWLTIICFFLWVPLSWSLGIILAS